MSDRSKIEWTDASWNPLRARKRGGQVGDPAWRNNLPGGKGGWHCEHVTEACRFCYAEAINRRLGTGLDFKPGYRADLEFFLDEKTLVQPLHWRKPRKIFVASMTDLFGSWVTDEQLDRIFAVMALCPQHTFIVLTKRPERMRTYWLGEHRYRDVHPLEDRINEIADAAGRMMEDGDNVHDSMLNLGWPLPNVWLLVSICDQPDADKFIPILLDTPAAVRGVSYEPALGPVDFTHVKWPWEGLGTWLDVIDRRWPERFPLGRGLDWVIVGGESGPHARPMHPGWARQARDQCAAAGVPLFFKQWGEWAPTDATMALDRIAVVVMPDGRVREWQAGFPTSRLISPEMRSVTRIGKKRAGRLLDGVEHNGFPQSATQSEAA